MTRRGVWTFTTGLAALMVSGGVGLGGCGSSSPTGAGGGAATGTGGTAATGTGGTVTSGTGGTMTTCANGVKDGAESDVDCGGPTCDGCALGQTCGGNGDCAVGSCIVGTCQTPPAGCMDGAKNGDESDVDCGGDMCPTCPDGKTCGAATDCTNGVCNGGLCASPTCNDSIKNGVETDVDCGGAICGKCPNGKTCAGNADCVSDTCTGNICSVPGPTCNDGAKNGAESDVDCGGATCAKCADGKTCGGNADCSSGSCMNGVCVMVGPACNDGVKNGAETDVDCGGGACAKCANGKTCGGNGDCVSGSCVGGACAGPAAGVLWSKRYGDATDQECFVVDTDPSNNVVLASFTNGFMDFGGGPIGHMNFAERITMAKLDPSGNQLWAKWYQTGSKQYPNGMAVNAGGDVFVAGSFYATITLGPPVADITSAGVDDFFSFGLKADSTPMWSKRFGDGAQFQQFNGLAVDPQGNPVMVGWLTGTANFGGGNVNGNNLDIVVVKLDKATGAHLWSKKFGDGNSQGAHAVAVDSAGNVLVTGYLNGSVDFGGGAIGGGGQNIFLLKLSSAGNFVWAKAFSSTKTEIKRQRIAVDGAGNVFLAGPKRGTVNFGGGALPTAAPGLYDAYIAKFDANGNHVWSKDFGDGEDQWVDDIKIDAGGNPIILGSFLGTMNLGNGNLTAIGGDEFGGDVFLAKFSPAGALLDSHRYGDAAHQKAWSLAIDSAGAVIVTGEFAGKIDFGNGALTSGGKLDIFVAKMNLP